MAIRLINNAPYNSHTESLFKSSAILPVNLIIDYFRIQFMHRFVHNPLPVSFDNCWTTNIARWEAHDGPVLRNEDNIFVPLSRLMSTERHPIIIFPKKWNELSSLELKTISSKILFNKKLKSIQLDQLDSDSKCNRLLCPVCHLQNWYFSFIFLLCFYFSLVCIWICCLSVAVGAPLLVTYAAVDWWWVCPSGLCPPYPFPYRPAVTHKSCPLYPMPPSSGYRIRAWQLCFLLCQFELVVQGTGFEPDSSVFCSVNLNSWCSGIRSTSLVQCLVWIGDISIL